MSPSRPVPHAFGRFGLGATELVRDGRCARHAAVLYAGWPVDCLCLLHARDAQPVGDTSQLRGANRASAGWYLLPWHVAAHDVGDLHARFVVMAQVCCRSRSCSVRSSSVLPYHLVLSDSSLVRRCSACCARPSYSVPSMWPWAHCWSDLHSSMVSRTCSKTLLPLWESEVLSLCANTRYPLPQPRTSRSPIARPARRTGCRHLQRYLPGSA